MFSNDNAIKIMLNVNIYHNNNSNKNLKKRTII